MKVRMKLVGIFLMGTIISSCYCQSCTDFVFSNKLVYASCHDLPVLNSTLHWNYNKPNHTADIAFRHGHVTDRNWVAWALNVDGSGMAGAQAIVALHNSSGDVRAYTSPVSGYDTRLQPGPLSFKVPKISAKFSGGEMVIFATVELPAGRTRFNQVWQHGPVAGGSSPRMHAMGGDNLKSTGSVDFAVSGQTTAAGEIDPGGSSDPRLHRRYVHGILNGLSWGFFMPIGAMSARYVRVFKSMDPAWFYLHIGIQTIAYITGVAGWATGLKLGHDSPGVTHHTHRNIGITLFCLGTLQALALVFRPKPDHKYRVFWNLYHHTTGYTVILLSIINVYEGLDILSAEKDLKGLYTGVIILIFAVALAFEAITWRIVLKRRRSEINNQATQSDNNNNEYGA